LLQGGRLILQLALLLVKPLSILHHSFLLLLNQLLLPLL
jgi:hypothetical protein